MLESVNDLKSLIYLHHDTKNQINFFFDIYKIKKLKQINTRNNNKEKL